MGDQIKLEMLTIQTVEAQDSRWFWLSRYVLPIATLSFCVHAFRGWVFQLLDHVGWGERPGMHS